MRKLPVLLIALFIILVASFAASAQVSPPAQTGTGVIGGTIFDAKDAVISGASVRLFGSGQTCSTTSKHDGSFEFSGLLLGEYSLTVKARGFLEGQLTGIMLSTMGEVRLDVHLLRAGDITSLCSPLYVSLPQVELPLIDRDPQRLVTLRPGVVQHKGEFSIAGRRLQNKNAILEEFDSRDPASGRFTVSIGLDSLSEFNSEYTNADTSVTSNYGQNSAPLLSELSKSGTNKYHGQGFWHLERTGFSANNFFTNRGALPRDQVMFDQAGFTLGGNLSLPGVFSGKDHAFFFISYEHTRDRRQTGRQIVAPLASFIERTSAVQGPLFRSLLSQNRIPLASEPSSGLQDVDGDGFSDVGDAAVRDRSSLARDLGLAHVALELTSALRLRFFYARDDARRLDGFGEAGFTPASPLDASRRGELAGLNFTAFLSQNTANNFRLGHLRGRTLLSGAGSDAPQIVALNTPLGVGSGVPELPERRDDTSWIVADALVHVVGPHTVRAEAQVIRRNERYASDGLSHGRIYYADALALVTDGVTSAGDPSRAIVRAELLDSPERERYRFSDLYVSVLDDFRATPRFAINYGTGYNVYSGAIYGTRTDRNNFAPFASFAFAPTHSESTILRGGAAILYAPPTRLPYGEIKATPFYPVATGFAKRAEIAGSPLPRAWPGREGAIEIEREFSRDLRTAYTESAFFALQQSFHDRLIVEVGYHSTFGHRLTRAYRNDRAGIGELLPGSSGSDEEAILIASDGNSSYHSMQVRVTSRERHRLIFQAHYTFSKSLDTASDDRVNMFQTLGLGPVHEAGAALERGPSDFDRRHRAVGFFQWRGPSLNHLKDNWRWMLSDWQMSGIVTIQSGPRVSLYSSGDFFGGLGDFNRDGVLNDRLAYLGSGSINSAITKSRAADGYLDRSLFGAPGAGGRAELGRNVLPAPGYGSIDLSVQKKFAPTEDHRIEIRVDVFNLVNRVNFAPPVTDFVSPDFGRSIEAGRARTVRLALKYSF